MRNAILNFLNRRPALFYLVYATLYKWQIWRANHLIIVTTPGHVGSSTTFKSLQTGSWPKGTRIYDVHSLNEGFNNTSIVNSISARHVLQSVLLNHSNNRKLSKKRVSIISLTRDPVSRALSGKFQNKEVFLIELERKVLNPTDFDKALMSVKHHLVNDNFLLLTCQWQSDFYEKEIFERWGFNRDTDVQSSEMGFRYLKNGQNECLFFALEYLSDHLISKVRSYLKAEISLHNYNSLASRESEFNDFYAYTNENLKLEKDLLERVYDRPIFRWMYGKVILNKYINQWESR